MAGRRTSAAKSRPILFWSSGEPISASHDMTSTTSLAASSKVGPLLGAHSQRIVSADGVPFWIDSLGEVRGRATRLRVDPAMLDSTRYPGAADTHLCMELLRTIAGTRPAKGAAILVWWGQRTYGLVGESAAKNYWDLVFVGPNAADLASQVASRLCGAGRAQCSSTKEDDFAKLSMDLAPLLVCGRGFVGLYNRDGAEVDELKRVAHPTGVGIRYEVRVGVIDTLKQARATEQFCEGQELEPSDGRRPKAPGHSEVGRAAGGMGTRPHFFPLRPATRPRVSGPFGQKRRRK